MKYYIITLSLIVSVTLGASRDGLYYSGAMDMSRDYAVDLAHPDGKKLTLPIGAANIACVAQVDSYLIGTTKPEYEKKSPIVFRYNLRTNELLDFVDIASLGLSGMRIGNGVVVSGGFAYFGTYGSKESTGRIVKVDYKGKKLSAELLPAIADKKGIFTIVLAPSGKSVYGILSPSNTFFSYDLETFKTKLYSGSEPTKNEAEAEKGMYSKGEPQGILEGMEAVLCPALGISKSGKVLGTKIYGTVFCYNPATDSMANIAAKLPCVRERDITNHVQSWVVADDGKMYGGTTVDGFLFRLDPESGEIINLGKPTHAGNLRSLFIKNGVIYGLVGHGYEYSHFVTYDIAKGNFEDNGIFRFRNKLINNRHRTFTASQILPLNDGRIAVAEDDLLPMLLFYVP
jgi:hypothetical protein